ncbi:hypothetical protein K439DRAFT_1164547 [Ramaria rubella]|nr:hypothetical protein K439DRAFT_1164547 [Ramaria rubella]
MLFIDFSLGIRFIVGGLPFSFKNILLCCLLGSKIQLTLVSKNLDVLFSILLSVCYSCGQCSKLIMSVYTATSYYREHRSL